MYQNVGLDYPERVSTSILSSEHSLDHAFGQVPTRSVFGSLVTNDALLPKKKSCRQFAIDLRDLEGKPG